MGNHPSSEHYTRQTVARVPPQPRPQPTPNTAYKQRRAPQPPLRTPSYKNPHCLVLPKDAPNGILRNKNEVNIPAEDYFTDDDEDAHSELDEPSEHFSVVSNASSQNRYSRRSDVHIKHRNYTPNGELSKPVSKSLPLETENNGRISNGLHDYRRNNKAMIDYDNRRIADGHAARMKALQNDSPRSLSQTSPSGNVNNESRVSFVTSQQAAPVLGEVVRPIFRKQKGRAPPPPRPPPPNTPSSQIPPTPPVVLPIPEPVQSEQIPKRKRLPSLHEQLQSDIINAAKARQSRDPVEPPKIEKPKTGEDKFRDELFKMRRRVESYSGEETDGDIIRDSEWETTYDPNDYKPKTTSKFLVKNDFGRLTKKQQTSEPTKIQVARQTSREKSDSGEQSENTRVARDRSKSIDSILGGSISLIQAKVEPTQAEWTPEQDLYDHVDDDDDIDRRGNPKTDMRDTDSAIYGPGMRMNMSEPSMGSVRMYRSKSEDRLKPDKNNRYSKHRNSDGSVKGKSSIKSFKDSVRSAFSSIGTSTKNNKSRKSVKGYFEQNGYHYGPDIRPVMYYHPNDPNQFYPPSYYQMPYRGQHVGHAAMSPTVPYNSPWYEDPYRMYPQRSVPMQPVLLTDGLHRRTVSMDELEYPPGYGAMPVYAEPRRSRSRDKGRSKYEDYNGSWSSLKDDIQYDQGSISRSWRRMKARARGRSKSRESLDDWNRSVENEYDSSDDEQSVTHMSGVRAPAGEASRRYKEAMDRGPSRRRVHTKKNVGSSSDENKPPNKVLRSHDSADGLPPSGSIRGRFRKRGSEGDMFNRSS